MCCLLAGCCGFALISLSVAINTSVITQLPRVIRKKASQSLSINCRFNIMTATHVEWYKASSFDADENERTKVTAGGRIDIFAGNQTKHPSLYFSHLNKEDSGAYFCKTDDKWGTGTEVEVVMDRVNRSNIKDGLIIFQAILLAMFLAAALLRNQQLQTEKKESDYDEPQTDHIYEGLAIETTGKDLYEDLCLYAQAEETEAPWK
ncbi:uncharacterized protein cd79b isoform X2 [Thalassophryne amazonica]|uniref:uncharacterized protein cd79b isoform X2 n=1 Tax=Thalassophryne amazonica TaxID=390379 RepID=UPI001470DA95|nr:uncharacterized protein cd79b isoform X2 [Thalassophryne amazonica]